VTEPADAETALLLAGSIQDSLCARPLPEDRSGVVNDIGRLEWATQDKAPSRPLPPIYLLEREYEILADAVCGSASPTPGIELLWRELQRAVILPTDEAPHDLVRLNSRVSYTDLVAPERRTVDIAGPAEPPRGRRALSVTSQVGAALIGLRVGDRFWWPSETGVRSLRVDGVDADPRVAVRRAIARAKSQRRRLDELLSLN
jgi:regulator of nucleoside diphosphate kinase